jgi:serine/threonine-protein kinase HipA
MLPKIAVHRELTITGSVQWYACRDGAPSTWIVKRAHPADSPAADVVDTEVAALVLAREVGLTTIKAEIVCFGSQRGIAVSRYDRRLRARDQGRPSVDRLHQEDLAQAIGLNTADPNRKFQWGGELPSYARAAGVLRQDGGAVDALLRQAAFSYLVGNTDMHAKNTSFLRYPNGSVALSPAYDVAMHLHHDRGPRRFALDYHGKWEIAEVGIADVIAEAASWGMPSDRAARVVRDLARSLAAALANIDRFDYPGVRDAAWAVVEDRVEDAVAASRSAILPETPRPSGPRRRGPRHR